MEKYRIAAEADSSSSIAFHCWGVILLEMGRYDEAITKFEIANKLNDMYYGTYTSWGNALLRQQKYDKAIKKYTSAISWFNTLETEDAQTLGSLNYIIAFCQEKNHKYELGIKYAKEAIRYNNKNIPAYQVWAQCLIKLEDNIGAAEKLEEALRIDQDNNKTYSMLIDLYRDMGKKKEVKRLEKERKKRNDNRMPHIRLETLEELEARENNNNIDNNE